MSFRISKLFFILIFLFLLYSPAIQAKDYKSQDIIIEELSDTEHRSGTIKMTFTVNSSPDDLWDLLVHYDKWPSFMPDLEKVEIRESSEKSAVVYVKAKAPLNLDISYVLKRLYHKSDYQITWKMLEGKAKEMEGSWKIMPISESKCRVIYTNYVDFGFIVPQKIVFLLTRQKLPDLANSIKKYLQNNAKIDKLDP